MHWETSSNTVYDELPRGFKRSRSINAGANLPDWLVIEAAH